MGALTRSRSQVQSPGFRTTAWTHFGRLGVLLAAIVLSASAVPAFTAPVQAAPGAAVPFPATVDWLAIRLSDPKLVLLHVGEKAEYDAEHIPGAQYVLRQELSTPSDSRPVLEMPPPDQLRRPAVRTPYRHAQSAARRLPH